jgi:hypothetical protein
VKLLTRDEFREGVFKRDGHKCVMCGNPAQDAHHIMERRLFEDGGYYLDNGASLCGPCHLRAEQTLISPAELYAKLRNVRILPPHLYPDYEYDKWGNIQNTNGMRVKGELFYDESVQKVLASGGVLDKFLPYIKYPRTFHLPFSQGRTDDDRALKGCSNFEGKEVVVTLKMDGENTTGYADGYIHARSLDSNNHPSRNWVKNFLPAKLYELPKDWRMCGENLYAKHSIHYTGLGTYFYLFSIWDERNNCLSWDDTVEWSKLLDLTTVPVIFSGKFDETKIRALGEWVEHNKETVEGFVIRVADKFSYSQFSKSVAKFVRKNHVQTNKHWIKQSISVNGL